MNTCEIINFILEKEEKKAGTFAKEIGVTSTQIYDLQSGKIKRISDGIANKILLVYLLLCLINNMFVFPAAIIAIPFCGRLQYFFYKDFPVGILI